MEVRNRIVLPAMDQNNCTEEGLVTDETIAHYEARARGGAGLLIVETSAVSYPRGATARHQPALSHDGVVPGLRRLAEAVHAHGARLVVQACHHGKTSSVDVSEGRPALIPSVPPPPSDPRGMMADTSMDELLRMATLTGGQMPTYAEATVEQLAGIVADFADAAARVQAAGCDGIEVHAAHGYLLSTFLSPAWNRREDEYGGSTGNRARLLVEVVTAIRERCGPDFAVLVRLDGHEYGVEGGTTVDLAAEHARAAVAAGADAIHVSATSSAGTGVGFTDAPLPWQPNQYEHLARTVKAAVDVPVIAVGRIRPSEGERILADGGADLVSLGRQLLADPDLPNRLADERPDLVRPCINCFVCVAQNFWSGKPVCAVNARLGHYDVPDPAPTVQARHVVVVGGGGSVVVVVVVSGGGGSDVVTDGGIVVVDAAVVVGAVVVVVVVVGATVVVVVVGAAVVGAAVVVAVVVVGAVVVGATDPWVEAQPATSTAPSSSAGWWGFTGPVSQNGDVWTRRLRPAWPGGSGSRGRRCAAPRDGPAPPPWRRPAAPPWRPPARGRAP